MTLSRRKFLLVSAATTAALSPIVAAAGRLGQPQKGDGALKPEGVPDAKPLPKPTTGAETFVTWTNLAAGVVAGIGAGGNSLVITSKSEATLVDTKFAWLGPHLRREANAAAQRITQVINTHHHADHTGGNHAFSTDLPILAHQNAKPRILAQTQQYVQSIPAGRKELADKKGQAPSMILGDIALLEQSAANLKPESWAPTRTLGDAEELSVGGVKVLARHFGPGHTDNDLVLVLPDLNVIHTGDLLFNRVYPYIDRSAKANTKGWCNSLREVIKLCKDDTIVVPGHGEVCDRSALSAQIKYFEDMLAFVRDQIKAGKSRDEITAMNPEPYDKYNGEWIRRVTLGGIFDEIKAEG